MIQRCFALPYYVYCLRLRCLVSFLFYSTIHGFHAEQKDTVLPKFCSKRSFEQAAEAVEPRPILCVQSAVVQPCLMLSDLTIYCFALKS
ncbi:Uncharacterised protein [Neisseria animalis]|nr:Uncharacterised protein [Neisseria animalis]